MGDLIDRQAVIEIINKHIFYEDYGNKDKIYLIDAIENLPSAEKRPTAEPTAEDCWGCNCPKMERLVEPKRGRWIRKEERVWYWYECSECGEEPLFKNGERVFSAYCPNCGARMGADE